MKRIISVFVCMMCLVAIVSQKLPVYAAEAEDVRINRPISNGPTLVGDYDFSGSGLSEGTSTFRWLKVSEADSLLGRPYLLHTTNNIDGVRSDPAGPSNLNQFTVSGPTMISWLGNYHYGTSDTPGTISLVHEDGTVYGPWDAVVDVYWTVYPDMIFPAGTYTIVDSKPESWSFNNASGNAGMGEVVGYTILDSNSQTYNLTNDDLNHKIMFEVTPVDENGLIGEPVLSRPYGPISNIINILDFEINCLDINGVDVTVNWTTIDCVEYYHVWYNGNRIDVVEASDDARFESVLIDEVALDRVSYVQVVGFSDGEECAISQNMKIIPVTIIADGDTLRSDYKEEVVIPVDSSKTILVEDGDELKIMVADGNNDFYYNDLLDAEAVSIYEPVVLMPEGYDNDVVVTISAVSPEDITDEEPIDDEPVDEEVEPVVAQPAPKVSYILEVTSTEGGSVLGFEGTNTFTSGTRVNLRVAAEEGYQFVGYEGDEVIDDVLVMNDNKSINAVFELIPVEEETGTAEEAEEAIEEIEDAEVPEDNGTTAEEEILDETIPEADPIPQTGGLPLFVYLAIGGALIKVGYESKKNK